MQATNFSIAQAGQEALRQHQAGNLAGAEALYRQILVHSPAHPEALHLLGLVAHQRGDDASAIELIRQAIAAGASAAMCSNLGHILQAHNLVWEAIECFRQAVEMQPDFAEALHNLGVSLFKIGDPQGAIVNYRSAIKKNAALHDCHSNLLLALQYSHVHTPAEVFDEHLRFAAQFEQVLKNAWKPHSNNRDPERQIRVGYVSGDLRTHAVAHFIEPILAGHDRQKFHISCYHNHSIHDTVTDRLKQYADQWRSCITWSDEQLEATIRDDRIDILIDLSGHTANNRLLTFARKPAPIQLTWIGYPGTTGLSAIDYRLTDVNLDPPGLTDRLHTEALIRMPAAATFRPHPNSPDVSALPAASADVFTFGCMNNLVKINSEVIQLWVEILLAVPNSRLMLGNINDALTRQRMAEAFSSRGISQERLLLQSHLPMTEYLALHHQIDLALDPFPYNGGTSTCHSLWMGVPVVTLAGGSTASRVGTGILQRIGLAEFIATTQDQYLQLASNYARDHARLGAIRSSLRASMAAIGTDSVGSLSRDLESVLRDIWRQWCQRPAMQASVNRPLD